MSSAGSFFCVVFHAFRVPQFWGSCQFAGTQWRKRCLILHWAFRAPQCAISHEQARNNCQLPLKTIHEGFNCKQPESCLAASLPAASTTASISKHIHNHSYIKHTTEQLHLYSSLWDRYWWESRAFKQKGALCGGRQKNFFILVVRLHRL